MTPENNPLPDGFHARPTSMDDTEALLKLFNHYWKAITGMNKFTLEEFKTIFSTPGFDMESSIRIVEAPDGQMAGSMLVIDLSSPPVHPRAYGCVHEDYEGLGIGSYLVAWAEERSRKAIERVPDVARVSMYVQTSPAHERTMRLFEKLELQPVRYSWFMMIELDQQPPEPAWPEGIRLQTYKEFPDLETIFAAVDEAFEDHWGHVEQEDNEQRLERFRHSIENDETFDPEIYYLVMDGDEIAGVALCVTHLGEEMDTGMVEVLGVRRSWRRQGLGLALLHQAFGEFYRRGYKRVGLGVDSQNLTGATRLYEKAGMHVERQFVISEMELRPGEELAKQE